MPATLTPPFRLFSNLLREAVSGRFVARVCRPDPWCLGLELGAGGALGFCWHPAAAAAGLCSWPWPRGTVPDALRGRLHGARLTGVEPEGDERILRVSFAGDDGASLVFEALGRSSNLLLLGEGDRVLWSGRVLGGDFRRGSPGETWRPPPAQGCRGVPGAAIPWPEDPGAAGEFIRAHMAERARAALLKGLGARRRSLERRRAAVEGDLDEGRAWLPFEAGGQALLSSGNLGQRGERARAVRDYSQVPPSDLEVPLDPSLTVLQNARRLFAKARKGKARLQKCEEVLREIGGALESIRVRESEIRCETDLRRLFPSPAAAREAGRAKSARRTLPRGVHAVPLPGGFQGYAGKSAAGNDAVSFRIGRGEDFWYHSGDYPGSHVVVKNPGRLDALPASVEQAAALFAAAHSQAPPGNRIGVTCARCKNLRKVPGAPGQVFVAGGRTLFVDLPRG